MDCGTCTKCKLETLAEQPEINDAKIGDTFIRRIIVKSANSYVPQHSHSYDHVTVLGTGAVELWEGSFFKGKVVAPAEILIKANVLHSFKTLEDNTTLFCIHKNGGSVPEILEENSLEKLEKVLCL